MKDFILELDYYEVLNLHKALLEAKFNMNPDNEMVSGSPLVAEIYIQLREMLMKYDESEQWKEWFQLKNRPDYKERAVMRIRKNRQWEKLSPDEKKKIAKNYLAPFIYDEQELNEVIAETVDNICFHFRKAVIKQESEAPYRMEMKRYDIGAEGRRTGDCQRD